MKLQQSSWPFILLLVAILLGIPFTEYMMEKEEEADAIVIEVKTEPLDIAELK